MRLRVLIVAVLLVAPIAAWLTWRSSHREPPRREVTQWEIHDAANGIGIVNSVVRCGDVAFLAEAQNQKVRRFDLRSATSSIFRIADGNPFALAADCAADTLWVLALVQASGARRPGYTIRELRMSSGATQRNYAIPGLHPANRMYRSGRRSLSTNQVSRPGVAADFFESASAGTYYRDAHLGQELSLDNGAVRPLVEPYEDDCAAGAFCSEVSVAPTPDGGWVAALPGSTHIATYASDGRLLRRVDVRTPGFRRTGPPLPTGAGPEETIRWGAP